MQLTRLESLLKTWEENRMEENIKEAIKLLRSNGYIVKKWTNAMEEDADECCEMEERGESKDCCDCACSICLMQ